MKAGEDFVEQIREDLESMKGTTFVATCYCDTQFIWYDDKDAAEVADEPKCTECGAELEEVHPAQFILDNPLLDTQSEEHREVLQTIAEEQG